MEPAGKKRDQKAGKNRRMKDCYQLSAERSRKKILRSVSPPCCLRGAHHSPKSEKEDQKTAERHSTQKKQHCVLCWVSIVPWQSLLPGRKLHCADSPSSIWSQNSSAEKRKQKQSARNAAGCKEAWQTFTRYQQLPSSHSSVTTTEMTGWVHAGSTRYVSKVK